MGINYKKAKGFLVDLDGTLYFQNPVRFGVALAMLKHYAVHVRAWRQLYGIYIFRKIREKEQFRTMTYD